MLTDLFFQAQCDCKEDISTHVAKLQKLFDLNDEMTKRSEHTLNVCLSRPAIDRLEVRCNAKFLELSMDGSTFHPLPFLGIALAIGRFFLWSREGGRKLAFLRHRLCLSGDSEFGFLWGRFSLLLRLASRVKKVSVWNSGGVSGRSGM